MITVDDEIVFLSVIDRIFFY